MIIGLTFFSVIVGGYLLQSYAILIFYYVWGQCRVKQWKSQPLRDATVGIIWAPPLFNRKPLRPSFNAALCTFNLIMAGCFAGFVAEAISRGQSRLVLSAWVSLTPLDWLRIVCVELVLLLAYESLVEYWWHRAMHTDVLYKAMHKLHHVNKAPEPFDDFMIHPVEAMGYYCILYAPPFIFPTSLQSFVLYMIVCGVCGVADHSGVKLKFPGLYDSQDHDLHHSRTNVNYGFPFNYTDKLFGTYSSAANSETKASQ